MIQLIWQHDKRYPSKNNPQLWLEDNLQFHQIRNQRCLGVRNEMFDGLSMKNIWILFLVEGFESRKLNFW